VGALARPQGRFRFRRVKAVKADSGPRFTRVARSNGSAQGILRGCVAHPYRPPHSLSTCTARGLRKGARPGVWILFMAALIKLCGLLTKVVGPRA